LNNGESVGQTFSPDEKGGELTGSLKKRFEPILKKTSMQAYNPSRSGEEETETTAIHKGVEKRNS